MESIYLKIKLLRRGQKIPALAFAQKFGHNSRQWTYSLEQGLIQKITPEMIKNLSEVLNKPESYFFDDDEPNIITGAQANFNDQEIDLDQYRSYKDKCFALLIENRKLRISYKNAKAENSRLKIVLAENSKGIQ